MVPDDPSTSRVAWVGADESRSNQSHPSLRKYGEKAEFWELLEIMENIAQRHGETRGVSVR